MHTLSCRLDVQVLLEKLTATIFLFIFLLSPSFPHLPHCLSVSAPLLPLPGLVFLLSMVCLFGLTVQQCRVRCRPLRHVAMDRPLGHVAMDDEHTAILYTTN